ncbi:hypothetical protein OF83DRAFT_1049912 [Amylostereum chailletii]|nr:hypothetical protein OF83DRAFT_1049912 [Amylostereum chailletii]
MSLFGKPAETVDFGQEMNYESYEWFKDPPPPRQAPTPAPPPSNYAPPPGIVDENQMLEFALQSAPNVLYGRFMQYGQLGVLAWCAEFSEMIDSLKRLGLDGNMFVSTRTAALQACEDILRLQLDVKMQIILIHMCSQIARLRRFLDVERQWEDYPTFDFPLEPTNYQ